MIKVFFDGNCPICSKEIKLYKKLSTDKKIEWYDIHSNKKSLKIIGKTKEECLKTFHVIENNQVFKEVEAFFVLWKKIKYFKYIYILLNFKFVINILNFFYRKYAKYRFKKLYNKTYSKD